jgi:hypothetical protein
VLGLRRTSFAPPKRKERLVQESPCPICDSPLATTSSGRYRCDSRLCGGIFFDPRLARAPSTADNWPQLLCAARELNNTYGSGATIVYDGTACYAQCLNSDGGDRLHEIRTYPVTVRERAMKLLAALARLTTDFGQRIELGNTDYPLAYVDSPEKLSPYLHYLEQNDFLSIETETLNHEACVFLTAVGLETFEGGKGAHQKIVFVSSSCRDLIDCRDELARHLRDIGYLVRMSEHPSSFDLPPDAGALASCLHNVETSDVVVAILDSRYGTSITSGDYAGKSVTHAEIDYALSCGIPVRAFIRRPAFSDWELLKSDPSSKPTWVEPDDEIRRRGWLDLLGRITQHAGDGLRSRWIDQFYSVVDLKSLVAQRLYSIRIDDR